MIEEVGVVTGCLPVVAYPPMIVTEPEAVGQVAFERRLVEWRHVTYERVEPLGLLLGWEQALSGAQRPPVDQQVVYRRDHLAGRPVWGGVPVGSVDGLRAGGLALEGVALGVRIGKGGVRAWGRGPFKAERFDDPFAIQLLDGLAGHFLEDEPEHHEVGVRVIPLGAG